MLEDASVGSQLSGNSTLFESDAFIATDHGHIVFEPNERCRTLVSEIIAQCSALAVPPLARSASHLNHRAIRPHSSSSVKPCPKLRRARQKADKRCDFGD